jgi:hypothetical protein
VACRLLMPIGRWRLRCRCLLIQSPRITALLKPRDCCDGEVL